MLRQAAQDGARGKRAAQGGSVFRDRDDPLRTLRR
jgi:hypothetical protein